MEEIPFTKDVTKLGHRSTLLGIPRESYRTNGKIYKQPATEHVSNYICCENIQIIKHFN